MNTLVVFDSQYGNTEKIARQICKSLGEFGTARAERVTELVPNALEGIELLVVGSPTQAWNATDPIKSFLERFEPALKRLIIAVFDTRVNRPRFLTGSAANVMAKELQQHNINPLVKPECFLVTGMEGPLAKGELEHAAAWARTLHEEFEFQVEPLDVPI